ncbi:preprotein translocase subunit SecE [Hathewaya histolytica]|uniref:Protein translocase subunit SecE n=1 Tax=Hathewaya histolytica TaxID=1498 RepID=A0A4U9RTT2_HATHI|nr:preprotein translocase subunit SecE [Hathewaya histolytica]VTQ95151.1 preprotein translocase subunit SecE [Hathewaya histolytica]
MSNNEKGKNEISSNNKGFINFFRGLKAEFKRITWAPKKDVKKATAAVVSFCILYMVLVGTLDAVFVNLYKLIFK